MTPDETSHRRAHWGAAIDSVGGIVRCLLGGRRCYVSRSCLFCLVLPTIARAQRRVALVIGNSAYKHAGELTNPIDSGAVDSSHILCGKVAVAVSARSNAAATR